jgi:cell division septal protein FtsQ
MRHYAELGDAEKVQQILEEKGDLIGLEKFYDKTSKSIAKTRKQIHLIMNDDNMSGEDKKEEIDRLKQIIAMAAEQAESNRKSFKD